MPRRKTQEEFIEEARTKHRDFYDYSKVSYVNSTTKVTLICPKHGDFEIAPGHHLRGVGCRKCFDARQRNDQDTILARFCETHGSYYNYDQVVYERADQKVTIRCPVHGKFKQTPTAHIAGSGCPKCATGGQSLTTKEFIKKAQSKHGDRYDYSQVKYVNSSTIVTIICPEHVLFYQLPYNHLKGNRCPECAKEAITEAQFGFEYKNIRYRSIKHACQALGKDYWVVLKRLDADWTLDQAFDDEYHTARHPFEVNSVIYNGIADAVRQLNAPVSATTVRRRLAEGMSPAEALFTPPKLGYDNGVIYVVTNLVNGKQYVGLTTTSLEQRWERHLEQVFRKEASLIHKAIAEFKEENFTIEVVAHASNIEELRFNERKWIQKLNTIAPNGYNVTLGGEIGGAPGKPTRLPGDPTLYPSVQAAAEALAKRAGINQEAAEKRLHVGRVDVKKPHGMTKTRIYKYWDWLTHQLTNPKSKDYNGSTICDRWKEFINFYEDIGKKYEEGLYLKLIDKNFPYSDNNCVWVAKNQLYVTHGMSGNRIYRLWSVLAHKTANPEAKAYKGIPLCSRWGDFIQFYEDMGEEYEEGKILQLIDPRQPYSKNNCCWIWVYGEQQVHPLFKTPIYEIWKRIVNESCNSESKGYNGSKICERWLEFASFCEDMASTYQEGFKLIRLSRDKSYSLENCEWKNRREAAQTHGMVGTKFYRLWKDLKSKSTNPASKSYKGTLLCERWQEFENFKADMYDSYKEGMGLKLIDLSQPYSKDNCQWMTGPELRKKHPMSDL